MAADAVDVAGAKAFRGIVSQTAHGILWTGLALALGAAVKVAMSRKMMPREMGIVLTAQAFTSLAVVGGTLGIPDAIARFVAIHTHDHSAPRRIVSNGLRAAFAVGVGVTVVGAIILTLDEGRLLPRDGLQAAFIILLALPFMALGDVLGAAYRGIGRLTTKIVLVDVTRPLILVTALILSPLALTQQAAFVAAIVAASALVSLALITVVFRTDRRWIQGHAVPSSDLLRFGIPLAGGALLAGPVFNSVLPLMLSGSSGPAPVALYSVTVSIFSLAYLPVGILEQAAIPTWVSIGSRQGDAALKAPFQRYSRMCFAGAGGLGLILLANDAALLHYVFGPAFEPARTPVRIAIVATLATALCGPSEGALNALGHSKLIFTGRLLGSLTGLAAGALLIPRFGLVGAVIAFGVTISSINGTYAVSLFRRTRIHPFTPAYAALIASVTAGLLVAIGLDPFAPLTARLIATLLGVAVLATQSDLRLAVRHLVSRS